MKKLALSVLLFGGLNAAFAQDTTGLIAHWDFNGTTNDVSGHGLHGITDSLSGMSSVAGFSGDPNTAYLFDGISSGMSVAYDDLLNLDSLSICAFFKPAGFYSGPCQDNILLIRGQQSSDGFYGMYYGDNAADIDCSVTTPDQHYLCVDGHGPSGYPTSAVWNTGDPIQADVWYTAVGTVKDDTVKLFINGIMTKVLYWPHTYAPSMDGLLIGYHSDPAYPYRFNGLMDDLRLYDHPFSEAEAIDYTNKMMGDASGIARVQDAFQVVVAPNPATSQVSVQAKLNGRAEGQMLNSAGQEVGRFTTDQSGSGTIDISRLPAGLYMLRLTAAQGSVVRSFIKQ